MTDNIIKIILDSVRPTKEIRALPNSQGIYIYSLNEFGDLGIFGKPDQIIYVGVSDDLNRREFRQHLMTGQTGWSSLRRSLGAILKTKLNLHAIQRDPDSENLRIDKYKFTQDGELRLTNWMLNNLNIGYWPDSIGLDETRLRFEEENIILKLKPTLDLDKRTRRFNPLESKLDILRGICRAEVKSKKLININEVDIKSETEEGNKSKSKKGSIRKFNKALNRIIKKRAKPTHSVIKKKKSKTIKKKRKSVSVRAISTSFESNRSRH